jgi:type VI protein secretion system component VasF
MDQTLRAADRDRDEVAGILREHYAQGRLTMEEFDERSTAAVSAKTMGELRALTADLPAAAEAGDDAAWSSARMRWIAVAGVAATAAVLGVVAFLGHSVLAWPSWLVVLIAVRVLRGRRGTPRRR